MSKSRLRKLTLKEIASVFIDGDWIEKKDQSNSGILLVQTGNVGLGYYKDKVDRKFVSEETFKRLKCKEVFPGDILISRLPDPVGKACIVPNLGIRMITAVDCTIFRPKKTFSVKYLNYLLNSRSALQQVERFLTGSSRRRISRKNLEKIEISIPFKNNQPDLKEQRRIADKIDKFFTETDKTIGQTKIALGNSKKLLQSEINKLSNNKDWKKIRLGDFFDLYQPKTISGNQILLKGSYKVYGANGVIGFYEKYNHEDEEVLMTCRGATCGTINISEKKSWINGNAMIIRPKKSNISKYFIAYILTSIDKIKAISGAAQPQITRKSLSPLEIPIPFVGDRPNTKEQKRIVIKLDKISDELKLLLEKYQNQLSNFNKLKQSILNYALAGKL